MKILRIYALMVVFGLFGMSGFSLVLAQNVAGGDRVARGGRYELNRQEAIHIARLNGVARARNVDRRGRYWIVMGEPRRGRDLLNVRIDARTGRVVGMNRLR